MKTTTSPPPAIAASLPESMLSWPSSGPMVRSSRKVSPAGKAPARNSTASLVDSSTEKLPVMMPEPPAMWLLNGWRRNHFVIKDDGKWCADIVSGVIPKLARA